MSGFTVRLGGNGCQREIRSASGFSVQATWVGFGVNKGQHRFGSVVSVPTPEQQKAFGDHLRRLLASHGDTFKEFGTMIAEGTRGVDRPYAPSTVRDWIEKSAPEPEIVFYMEGYLLQPPGTLSQHLGYLPLDARSVTTTEQALMNDPQLDTGARDILITLYAVLADVPLVYATLGQFTRGALQRLVDDATRTADLLESNRMVFDDAGRLVDGFEVAPPNVVMRALHEWGQERAPDVPMPRGLIAAAVKHRATAAEWELTDRVAEWDAVLRTQLTNDEFALAAEGGLPEQVGPEEKRPRPEPEPDAP